MALDITPLHSHFAAEVRGFDFSAAPEAMPMDAVRAAIAQYGVLVFRNDTPPSDEQHIAFSRALGPIELGQIIKVTGFTKRRVRYGELVDVGNLDAEGNIFPPDHRRMLFRKGDRLWHADMSFMENRATYSMLVGHEIPPQGGDTEFVDTRTAYEELPASLQTLCNGLQVEHSIWHSRMLSGFPEPTAEELASRPPVHHGLTHLHEPSGRRALYLASHASHILDWPLDLGRGLLAELTRFATRPERIYRHKWCLGDMLMWDNLATLHRATEFEDSIYRRDMRRTTCREREIGAEAPAYA